MKGILVDSNIILDVFLDDPNWAEWSESKLEKFGAMTGLFINPVVYSEVSIGFKKIEEMESAMSRSGFTMLEIPKEALFLAGKAFLKYGLYRAGRHGGGIFQRLFGNSRFGFFHFAGSEMGRCCGTRREQNITIDENFCGNRFRFS